MVSIILTAAVSRILGRGTSCRITISIRDHEHRVAWLGESYGLDLSNLPVYSEEIPLQYSALSTSSDPFGDLDPYSLSWTFVGLGYSAPASLSIEDRLKLGSNVEAILSSDKNAEKAPPRDFSLWKHRCITSKFCKSKAIADPFGKLYMKAINMNDIQIFKAW